MKYLWLLLALLSAGAEALTAKWIAFSFLPSAVAAMVLAFFDVSVVIQLFVFFGGAFIFMICLKGIFRSAFSAKGKKRSIDSAIGEKCVVAERIDNLAGRGAVIFDGMEWAARTVSDEITVEEGERVEVIAVEGVRLVCQKRV